MIWRRDPRAVALVVAVATFGAVARAQTGSIRGIVIDQDFAAPLGGATVQVVETGLRVETNEQGNFVVPDLRPGSYTLIVRKDGYVQQVRSTAAAAGKLTDVRIELLGDFTDLEEYVVEDALTVGTGTEQALLDLRTESPALIDSISRDLMAKANVSDASQAIRFVAGASSADGKSAVIRGLPDRYVSSQINGVLLPSSDVDKRSIELDQFPAVVIESLQVSKTFTPDQLGNASGGAVNVLLRGIPDEPLFFNWKVGTKYNSQVSGRSNFLTYDGGGVHGFGKSGHERAIQEDGENWEGAVGAKTGEAPGFFNWQGGLGGKLDIGNGWRVGGLANFFYNRSASYFANGKDESRIIAHVGDLMSPRIALGTTSQAPFVTSLLSLTRATETLNYGGLSTLGIANDDHAITAAFLFTQSAEDTVTLAEDTQGKQYFFPGHDPKDPTSPGWDQIDSAPYTRQQTLAYIERSTRTVQLNGRHRFETYGFGPLRRVEFDWTVSQSTARRDTPDRRQFAEYWLPTGVYLPLKPAAQFTLGNLQRTFIKVDERSEEAALNAKLPFELWDGKKGYVKAGLFRDQVTRRFRQETFSNFNDPTLTPYMAGFEGPDWSTHWQFEDHPITGAETDVDYDGRQKIDASYLMLEMPLVDRVKVVGGVRFENSTLSIRSDWEANATWVPPTNEFGQPNFSPAEFPARPGEANFDPVAYAQANPTLSKQNVLPAVALIYDVLDNVTLRSSYTETLARPTFKEISPVFQQDYIGGPIFIGDPSIQFSTLKNVDFRVDYTPVEGSLLSFTYFKKFIKNPIEYIEAATTFQFTRPRNFPAATLSGYEVEARQDLGKVWDPLAGLGVGGNSTWIDSAVRLSDQDITQFEQFQGVRPKSTREMTGAPHYVWNLFTTYDLAPSGTSLALFYTVTGDTLIQGPGPANAQYSPATYDRRFDNLSATIGQDLGRGVRLTLSATNLTDAMRRQVYRSEYVPEDVTRRTYKTGVTYTLQIGGEIHF